MAEKDMRARIIKALTRLDAIAVENTALPGTQDVNFVEGWLELKWLRSWPARPETVVELDHFTPQQRIRQIKRSRVGGNTWLLLEVRDQWLLFEGSVAAVVVGKANRATLIEAATRVWLIGLNEQELIRCISRG